MEAVLHAKLMERRIQANSNATNANSNLISTTVPGSLAGKLNTTSPIVAKCSFNFTSSTKCGDICIPMTKFCQKHIINDPNQVLFRWDHYIHAVWTAGGHRRKPCSIFWWGLPRVPSFRLHFCTTHFFWRFFWRFFLTIFKNCLDEIFSPKKTGFSLVKNTSKKIFDYNIFKKNLN